MQTAIKQETEFKFTTGGEKKISLDRMYEIQANNFTTSNILSGRERNEI